MLYQCVEPTGDLVALTAWCQELGGRRRARGTTGHGLVSGTRPAARTRLRQAVRGARVVAVSAQVKAPTGQ